MLPSKKSLKNSMGEPSSCLPRQIDAVLIFTDTKKLKTALDSSAAVVAC
jgi:hypothetical protein